MDATPRDAAPFPLPTDPAVVTAEGTIRDVPVVEVTSSTPGQAPQPDLWSKPAPRWIGLIVATALILYLCWLILLPFLDVLLWAIVLAVVFRPMHRRIAAKLKSPSWSAALSCLIVILVIVIPVLLVTAAVVRDVVEVARSVQEHKDEWMQPNPASKPGKAINWANQYVNLDLAKSREWLATRAKAVAGTIAAGTLNIIGGTIGVIVDIFFVLFTLFYLFRDGKALAADFGRVLPVDRWQAHSIFKRTRDVIYASVNGSLIIAVIQGALGGLAFWVLGLPSPLIWGAVMIVMSMVPVLGAFVVWVPAALYLLATGHWGKALILTGWGTLVIGTIDNVLRPKLVGERTRMHELVIFFAVLGGLQVFGILGLIVGPVIAAIAIAMFHVWKEARLVLAQDQPPRTTSDPPLVAEPSPAPVAQPT